MRNPTKTEYQLFRGDCLEVLPTLPSESVDLVLCDLPYGILNCAWDRKLPLATLWKEWKRLLRPRGAVLLFGQQPFCTELIVSNRAWFRYEWIWEKSNALGFLNAKRMPMRAHENVLVFYPRLPRYNPRMTPGKPYVSNSRAKGSYAGYSASRSVATVNTGERYPRSVLKFANPKRTVHPTQKPLDLCEYLIRTYTDERDTVLDNCMGSGVVGIACARSGRNFIGVEKEAAFFDGRTGTGFRLAHVFAAHQPEHYRTA